MPLGRRKKDVQRIRLTMTKELLTIFCLEPKLVQIHMQFSKKNLSLERMEKLGMTLIK